MCLKRTGGTGHFEKLRYNDDIMILFKSGRKPPFDTGRQEACETKIWARNKKYAVTIHTNSKRFHAFYIMMFLAYIVLGFTLLLATGKVDGSNALEEVRVPVIDLAPWLESTTRAKDDDEFKSRNHLNEDQLAIVNSIREACKEVGFFQIQGYDSIVDSRILENAKKASNDFFGLPLDEKKQYQSSNTTEYPYGYEVSGHLSTSVLTCHGHACQDQKETFSLGPPDDNGSGMPPRRWSNISKDFQSSMEDYFEAMEYLAEILLQVLALALQEEYDFFVNKMDHHQSALRFLHYYPLNTTTLDSKIVRAGAHTDYGAFTILEAQEEGLQVLLPDTANSGGNGDSMKWFSVPVTPGAFVINLGDLMQTWTQGNWVSTMHRVAMPANEERYSMAYFVNLNGDTLIEPLGNVNHNHDDDNKFPVITAGEHLLARYMASIGKLEIDPTRETEL